MSENLRILHKKLSTLERLQADVRHSLGKLPSPLDTIAKDGPTALTPDQRETLSAFTTRFAIYQEQLGKTMKGIAVEEEHPTSPFGAVLALMHKLYILDDVAKWKLARDLRNSASHDYQDDARDLHQILSAMADVCPWLFTLHQRLDSFVAASYQAEN